jgi:IclR family KDG regulon transcriptional repressor
MGKTIHKAFAVLEILAAAAGPMRVRDLCREVELSESNVSRLLSSLVELGYATRDADSGHYAATMKIWQVGMQTVARTGDLQAVANPLLSQLSERTGESVALGVLDDGYAVYVGKADGRGAIKAVAHVGARLPATATGFGKAVLAWRPELVNDSLARIKRFTPHTLLTRADIERDLAATRARGFALTRGELFPEVCAIGCPIFDSGGVAIAALALWGAESRITGPRMARLVREAQETAHEISVRFGYTGPALCGIPAVPGSKARTPAKRKRPS